jgi:hypothetical protein
VLRRRYDIDHIPFRGVVRSKIWLFLKIGSINMKRVLRKAVAFPQKNLGKIKKPLLLILPKSSKKLLAEVA